MADEKQEQEQEQDQYKRTMKVRRSPDYIAYYANNIRLAVSFFDIRMICGEALADENGDLLFNDRVAIVLSPQHAKVFLKRLRDNIKAYEDQFGPIPERPESETSATIEE